MICFWWVHLGVLNIWWCWCCSCIWPNSLTFLSRTWYVSYHLFSLSLLNTCKNSPSADHSVCSSPIVPYVLSSPSPPLRRPLRVFKPLNYLKDYSCSKCTNLLVLNQLQFNLMTMLLPFPMIISPKYQSFVLALQPAVSDPDFFSQAVKHSHWRDAMDKEIAALELITTWTLTPQPPGKSPIGSIRPFNLNNIVLLIDFVIYFSFWYWLIH